jgi:CRP-like cAMP-binding protein
MLCAAVLYAFGVATAINVMLSMRRETFDQSQTLNDLNKFLDVNKLPQPLRIRVRRYFQQVFRYRVITRTQEQQLMKRMSPELRGLCARHMGEQWMSEVPFLNSLSTPLIAELFVMLRLQTFIPRERIFGPDDVADRMYILRRGSVFVRNKLLTPNKCFGEEMILSTAARRGYIAQALQYVETYVLFRKDFLELLEGKPEVLKRVRRDVIKMSFCRCARDAVHRLAAEHQRATASVGATENHEPPPSPAKPPNSRTATPPG